MENITTTEGLTTGARNKMAALYGFILGMVYIILSTVTNLTMSNSMGMLSMVSILNYVLFLIIVGIFARMIRKANGGFIEFKELYGSIFVMVLVAGLMTYTYNYIYVNYIDPGFVEKVTDFAKGKIEKLNLPDDKMDEMLAEMDKSTADSKKFSILSLLGQIVRDCLFGLIPCAIVKKPRPIF